MANKNFTDFTLKTPLLSSDYIVGYNTQGTEEIKVPVQSVVSLTNLQAPVKSVNGQIGNVALNQANIPPQNIYFEVESSNPALPTGIDLGNYVQNSSVLNAIVIVANPIPLGYANIVLPDLSQDYQSFGYVEIRTDNFEDGDACLVTVRRPGQAAELIWSDELVPNHSYIFRWLGNRWDIDLLCSNPLGFVSNNLIKPDYNGTLVAWSSTSPASASNINGIPGMMRYGFDVGQNKYFLYVCVANNTWRRTELVNWP